MVFMVERLVPKTLERVEVNALHLRCLFSALSVPSVFNYYGAPHL